MSDRVIACGIDFGTTNSAVALALADGVRVVRVDTERRPSLPSVAHLHRDGERSAGEGAAARYYRTATDRTACAGCSLVEYGFSRCRHHRRDGGCADSRLVTGVKRDFGRVRGAATHSWAIDLTVGDLAAVILTALKGAADREAGRAVDRVVLGHPVVFPAARDAGGPVQQLALDQLREAATTAGFSEIAFFPEPIAAVLDEELDDGWVLSLDVGGGTYDVALLRVTAGHPEVVGLGGAVIGGEQIDEALFEARVGPALGFDSLPYWLANEMRSLAGARQLLMDPRLPGVLSGLGTAPARRAAAAILYGGFVFDFYKAMEAAKIRLSSHPAVDIRYHRPGIALDLTVRREELERIVAPELDAVVASTVAVLDEAGVRPAEVRRVLRTGGTSRMPAFVSRVAALCPTAAIEERDAFTGVARGLGVRARRLWLRD